MVFNEFDDSGNSENISIVDGTDPSKKVEVDINKQLKSSDICNESTICGNITVGTTAVVAKVGASNKVNRKVLNIFYNGNGKLYWGCSAITTSTGTQIFKNTSVSIPAGPSNSIYLISDTAGQDVRIVEMS